MKVLTLDVSKAILYTGSVAQLVANVQNAVVAVMMYVGVNCRRLEEVDSGVVIVGAGWNQRCHTKQSCAVELSGIDDGAGYGVCSVSVNDTYYMLKTADVIVAGLNDLGHMIVQTEIAVNCDTK